jgi:tetratricopeptide (TPR) repeat protein
MTPERWQRVKQVFSEASALPPDAQRQYLDRACAGDAPLRAEVDSLLGAHNEPNVVFDRPAVSYVIEPAPSEQWIGKRIGAYEIVSLLGQGGMGRVYRARRVDAEYEKEVAIKVVPGAYAASTVLQRLRAERQILATLEHPNIARLIDGGATADGSPYLVMELVEGEALDRYCREHKLPIRERLRLFREVCSAVSYAHQRLVVHRDLKPGNILVSADGAVKLLDFGIAKLLQAAPGDTGGAPTATLMRMLTPGYSSPEQVLGRPITTASDVYSLGVVLYGLLAGRSPYRSTLESTADVIRDVCELEPLRPSEAATGGEPVSRDLDAIVLRALRKEPDRRYRSVDEFSEDVRRYLAGLPVLARGDELSYRAGKFLRRRKLEIAGGLIVVLALVGGLAISVRQTRIAEQQRERAERHFASVRKLADGFMFEVHDAIRDLPGSTQARKLLVEKALEYLNTLANESGQDRGLRVDLAVAYNKVGAIQGGAYQPNVGAPTAALDSYSKAVALLEPLVAAGTADDAASRTLARAYVEVGNLILLTGDAKGALANVGKAIAILEESGRRDPSVENLRLLASALSAQSYQLGYSGDPAGGLRAATRSVEILEELWRRRPEDPEMMSALAVGYGNTAVAINTNGPGAEARDRALAMHEKALRLDEQLLQGSGGRNTSYARAVVADRSNLATLLYEKQSWAESVAQARAAEPALAILLADRNNSQGRMDGSLLHWHLGRALLAGGDTTGAQKVLTQNLATLQEIEKTADNLQVQYIIGACEQAMATIHVRLAPEAKRDPEGRLEQLRRARQLYERALPRFAKVSAAVTLDKVDQGPIDDAMAGLGKIREELATSGRRGP